MKQSPQEIWNGITTRSPTFSSVTADAHLLDDAHRLVAEDHPCADERPEDLVEVQIGAADSPSW